MIDNTTTDMIKTVTDIIEEARNEMCIDYCKEWEEPCRMCKRNCKDYWRRGAKE